MATRRLSGIATSSSVPDNGGDHSGGGGGAGGYVDDVFSTYLYTGNGSTQTITNGIDLAGEGGLVWTKGRDYASYHILHDTERGKTKYFLLPDTSGSQTDSSGALISSFNNDGYSLGTAGTVNTSGRDYASWTFRKQPGFFDVVTYTGTGSAQNISHSLGSAPGMIIVKRTDDASVWGVFHRSLGATKKITLNETTASETRSDYWNDTEPTDSQFTVGTSTQVNRSGGTYVAYLFAHDDSDESMIKCGSYTGTGTANGPEIDLGWEPQYILIKCSGSAQPWMVFDTMRGIVTGGDHDAYLHPNQNAQEMYGYPFIEVTPTGFRLTHQGGYVNGADEYIYMAIRRPDKPAEEFDPDELFAVASQTNSIPSFNAGFVVDMAFQKDINSEFSLQPILTSRLIQGKHLTTSSSSGEKSISSRDYDHNTGYSSGLGNNSASLSWMWRRAPGFFDVVTYTGGPSYPQTVPHNLGVVPEMIWVKDRANAIGWKVWHTEIGVDSYLELNTPTPERPDRSVWNNMVPDESAFYPNANGVNDRDSPYVAYLFASAPGISKIGKYTGTGAELDVNCGFTTGARFVLIKRLDSTGDWYVWDTERGIASGNDPYLLLNDTAAQVTNTDYIDPLSSGFKVTASAPAAINASGGEYLFYAIA